MKIVSIKEAEQILCSGNLVAIPTETVYGLAADGLNEQAVEKIYSLKKRPAKNPLILHVSSLEMLAGLVKSISEKSKLLMEKFWPGPLTLVFDKSVLVPNIVTAGLETVCIRMPKTKVALDLITALNRPLAAPSANISGRPSPTSAAMVARDFPELAVLDDGECQFGLESTVVDARGDQVKVLRLGSLAIDELELFLGEEVLFSDGDGANNSPGKAFKHYSPKGEVILIWPWESFGHKKAKKMESDHATVETAYAIFYGQFKCGIVGVASREKLYLGYDYLSLGNSVEEQAKNLFSVLHQTELLGWEKVLVDMTGIGGEKGLGPAVLERLRRSAEG